MPLVKYSQKEIEEKKSELQRFIRHFPFTKIIVNEGYLIYTIEKDLMKVKEQANSLSRKLGLRLRATILEVNKIRVG